MELRLALSCLFAASVVSLATTGCMKAGAPAGVPTMVVPVASVDGPPLSVMGPAPIAHHPAENDGHTAGDRVEIRWQGSWLPATLLERRGDRWLVRFDAREDDARTYLEEVEREHIRLPAPLPDSEDAEVDVDP